MKKVKTIFIQVRTCDEENWVTIGARCSRYTEFTQAIREYDFMDFFLAVWSKRFYNWEFNYFKAKINFFTGTKKVICTTKNIEMTEKSCSKIFIKEIAFEQDLSNIHLKTLFEVLPAKDFIEFVQDNIKKEIDIIQNKE